MKWEINYDFCCLSKVLKCLGMTNSLRDSKESYRQTFILEKCMYAQNLQITSGPKVTDMWQGANDGFISSQTLFSIDVYI